MRFARAAILLAAAAAFAGAPADDFVLPDATVAIPAPLASALAGIKAPALDGHLHFLSSPALAGRGLGTPGLDAAAEYAAATLARAGIEPLQPAAEGGSRWARWFQAVPVREVREFALELGLEVRHGDEWLRRSLAPGVDAIVTGCALGEHRVPVYFAGAAPIGPEVRGKAVLVLRDKPGAAGDPEDRWNRVFDAARAQGAAAVLALDGIDTPQELATSEVPRTFFLPLDDPHPAPAFARLGAAAARAFYEAAGVEPASARSAAPHDVAGALLTIRATGRESVIVARNVIAVIPGSDPKLRDEAVVAGAHLDHLGRIGDRIHPGADDNASGVSALLEIARALASTGKAPKRTLVIAFWAGEEEGKFGSGWYVAHPLWPLARTAAYVNFDMIGHPWSMEEIRKLAGSEPFSSRIAPAWFAEPGLPVDAPQLADALRWAASPSGMALHLDRCDGTHGGSDYRDFARANVPWIRFFGNFFPDYHKPGDTADALDATQVERMARLGLATIWKLAADQ